MVLGSEWLHENADALNIDRALIQPASVDVKLSENSKNVSRANNQLYLPPHCSALLATEEYIKMPNDVACQILLKSSKARAGLVMGGGWVDPGYHGVLTVAVQTGDSGVTLKISEPFAQLVFQQVGYINSSYNGRYQGSNAATSEIISERALEEVK